MARKHGRKWTRTRGLGQACSTKGTRGLGQACSTKGTRGLGQAYGTKAWSQVDEDEGFRAGMQHERDEGFRAGVQHIVGTCTAKSIVESHRKKSIANGLQRGRGPARLWQGCGDQARGKVLAKSIPTVGGPESVDGSVKPIPRGCLH